MPGFVGIPELLLLGMVLLLIFGPKRLPEMGKSLGKGLREFKDSVGGNKPNDREFDLEALAREPMHTSAADSADAPVAVEHSR